MLITLLAIAAELHLLFNNKSSICIDYEDLNNLFNRICSENAQTHCSTTIAYCVRNLHAQLKSTITFQIGRVWVIKIFNFYCEECTPIIEQ